MQSQNEPAAGRGGKKKADRNGRRRNLAVSSLRQAVKSQRATARTATYKQASSPSQWWENIKPVPGRESEKVLQNIERKKINHEAKRALLKWAVAGGQ